MSEQETLERAIQKAIGGGWDSPQRAEVLANSIVNDGTYYQLEPLIFNHDFAKALWGEEPRYQPESNWDAYDYWWEYHLKRMVLSDDPIKYLEQNM